jgi:hypothetical protein
MKRATRRRFISTLAAGTACALPLGGIQTRVSMALIPDPRVERLAKVLSSLVRAPQELVARGQAHLRRYEIRPGVEQLVRELLPAAASSADALKLDVLALKRAVRASIEDDFRTGSLLSVGGWLMSITEARLCALIALVTAPSGMTARASRRS